jgi:hypothetical protein
MVELKVYLWGRLMMDPTQNITALTQEFLEGYYSAAAAPHVMKYLQVLDKSMRERGGGLPGAPRPYPTNSPESRAANKWGWGAYAAVFDFPTLLSAAGALADASAATTAAGAASSDPKYSFRVSQAMAALQFVAFYRWAELQAYAASQQLAWPFATSVAVEFDRFHAALNHSGTMRQPLWKDGGMLGKCKAKEGHGDKHGWTICIKAGMAPDNTTNAGGTVTIEEFRAQVCRKPQGLIKI